MSISLLAAAGATLVAAVFTALQVMRTARAPRIDLIAWLCAMAGLTIALAAQALGFSGGFTGTTFRAVQLGAQLVAPIALVWGLAEVSGKHFGARFAARLGLAALTVIAGVIMATDPLGGGSFSTAWPAAATYYQILPNGALTLIAVVTVLSALVAAIMAGARSRTRPVWRQMLLPVLAAAGAALLTQGLREALPVKTGYPALCLAAAALTWFAGRGSGRVELAGLHGRDPEPDADWEGYGSYGDDTGYGGYYRDETGAFAPGTDAGYGDTGYGDLYRPGTGDTGYSDAYQPDTGTFGGGADTGYGDTGYGDLYRPGTGAHAMTGADTGYGLYRDPDTGFGQVSHLGNGSGPASAIETGDLMPVLEAYGALGGAASVDTASLYGQIAIYTLVEGHAEEFDRLAQDVVGQVAAHEPDTLIYVMHGVPSAPMQRILYEVYRDETAFSDHGRQPYVREFRDGHQACVLATNVIELGVRQAKVEPLPDMPPPDRPGGRQWGEDLR